MARIPFSFSSNPDTGSLLLKELPAQYRKNATRPEGLSLQLDGESRVRTITYVMGSEAKGFSVCCKGSGPFPPAGEGELILPE